jgi:hypothetical protein
MFKKIIGWFHRHPKVKVVAVTIGSAAAGGAAQAITGGSTDPRQIGRAAGIAAAAAVYGLFIKRPQDGAGQ